VDDQGMTAGLSLNLERGQRGSTRP
jgi:hypothetical protein